MTVLKFIAEPGVCVYTNGRAVPEFLQDAVVRMVEARGLDTCAQAAALRGVLAAGGIAPALALLNDRTSYRYTGIYQLCGDAMMPLHMFDRDAAHRTWPRAVPLGKSLCQRIVQDGEFMTTHASTDDRLAHHPQAGVVESYYGRLLSREDGKPYGAFVHFDMAPCTITGREKALLVHVVPQFLGYLEPLENASRKALDESACAVSASGMARPILTNSWTTPR